MSTAKEPPEDAQRSKPIPHPHEPWKSPGNRDPKYIVKVSLKTKRRG